MRREEEFKLELMKVLNKFSGEGDSDTPDFILMEFLVSTLIALNKAINDRDKWYGIDNDIKLNSEVPDNVDLLKVIKTLTKNIEISNKDKNYGN